MTAHIKVFIVLTTLLLTACSGMRTTHSYVAPEPPAHSANNYYQPAMSELSVKAYSYMLADELLANKSHAINGNVAVVEFVSETQRQNNDVSGHPLTGLGGVLAENMMYELTKRGINVIDYKVMDSIKVSGNNEQLWSTSSAELPQSINARYVLSGTLSEHENGCIVNVRLIEHRNKQVIAAAQGFVPINALASDQNITMKDGFLIHKGERRRSF